MCNRVAGPGATWARTCHAFATRCGHTRMSHTQSHTHVTHACHTYVQRWKAPRSHHHRPRHHRCPGQAAPLAAHLHRCRPAHLLRRHRLRCRLPRPWRCVAVVVGRARHSPCAHVPRCPAPAASVCNQRRSSATLAAAVLHPLQRRHGWQQAATVQGVMSRATHQAGLLCWKMGGVLK